MPLKVRVPFIIVGACVLTWMMNGGAPVVVGAIVDTLHPVPRGLDGTLERARRRAPEAAAWTEQVAERARGLAGDGELLAGLEVVVFHEAVADDAVGGGAVQAGPFYDPPTRTAFLDVAYFTVLDEFAGAQADAAKGYVAARVLARHLDPAAEGPALEASAGRVAAALDLIPGRFHGPGPMAAVIGWPTLVDTNLRAPHVPPGWTNHRAGPELPAPRAAAAFLRGLTGGR